FQVSGFAHFVSFICLALLGVIENNKLQTTTAREANSLLTPETYVICRRYTLDQAIIDKVLSMLLR
ncbi:MAG: hypothetical protein U9R43_17405, partial [Thermodesulfobacteriota bacterium]|nr:hypothetical protein [Thermodesulfobacteriota bacterium]